jgi:hypothetical protein
MMRILIILSVLILASCVTPPDLVSGDGCWRYGVLESEGNTGRMTTADPTTIRVERYGYFDLLVMCDQMDYRTLARQRREGNSMVISSCFKPREVNGKAGEDMIYMHRWAGKAELYQEQCHALLGSKHNNCYPRYGIGKTESDCNWDT